MKFALILSLLTLNFAFAKDLSKLRCVSNELGLVLDWNQSYGELQFKELAEGYEVYFDDSIVLEKSIDLETPAFLGKSLYTLNYVGDSEPEVVAEIAVDGFDKAVVTVKYAYGDGQDGDLKINGEYLCE